MGVNYSCPVINATDKEITEGGVFAPCAGTEQNNQDILNTSMIIAISSNSVIAGVIIIGLLLWFSIGEKKI